MTLSTRNTVILLAIIGAVVAALWLLDSSAFYEWQQKRMVKRVLVADPAELLSVGRALLASRPGFVGEIRSSSPDVPIAIRRLKPSHISMSTNSLGVDFSDLFNPFGIIVYAVGVNAPAEPKSGIGPRKWIDGLSIYDDGQLENFGQQNRCSEREPADSRRHKWNIIGGWLPSLTFALCVRTQSRSQ